MILVTRSIDNSSFGFRMYDNTQGVSRILCEEFGFNHFGEIMTFVTQIKEAVLKGSMQEYRNGLVRGINIIYKGEVIYSTGGFMDSDSSSEFINSLKICCSAEVKVVGC